MNIQTDIELSYELLEASSYSWSNLVRIARQGTEEQRDILLTWASGNLPYLMWEDLVYAAERTPASKS